MLALLKLVPLKDWIYGALIAALLISFGWYTHHERQIGAQSVQIANAKAAQVQIALKAEKEAHAKDVVDTAVAVYQNVLAAQPAPDAPHLRVCPAASTAGAVRPSAGSEPVADAAPDSASAGSSADERDIGPPLDKINQDSDAQVIALQAYIRACQDAGACKKENN